MPDTPNQPAYRMRSLDRVLHYGDKPRTEAEVKALRQMNALRVEDERVALAIAALPKVRELFALIKPIADKIDRTERRCGTERMMHLARLCDDLWMACDNFGCDVGDMDRDDA